MVGAAAVLPCFWIYAEVGRDLAARASGVLATDLQHPYAQWVTTYDAPEFHAAVATARNMSPGDVYAQLQKAGRLPELERSISEEKAFAWLLSQSTVVEATS